VIDSKAESISLEQHSQKFRQVPNKIYKD